MPKAMATKIIEICEHDACLVRYALAQRLKAVSAESNLLQIARMRDLNEMERAQLSPHMQQLPREELAEQVDAWISLADTISSLIQEFTIK